MMPSMETDALAPPTAQSPLFEATFDLVSTALILLDNQGRILKVNGASSELLGYAAPELLGKPLLDILHPNDRGNQQARLSGCLAGAPFELHYRRKDGPHLQMRLTASAARAGEGQPLYFVVQIEDLSRLLEIEERLALLDFALSRVHEAAYLIDHQARIRYVNDEACRALGYGREELLRMTIADIDPDWTNEQVSAFWHSIQESPAEIFETRHRSKDGHIFPTEISATYIELGGQGYSLSLARDISERKRLQAAQRESERRCREVFDYSSDCLYLLEVSADRRFRYLEVNTAFERSSGLSRERLIGRYLGESPVEETACKVLAQLERCLAGGENVEWEDELELPSGAIAVHSTFIPVRDEQGRIYHIVGISRDISERKQMETRLLTSEQQFRALAENSLNLIIRYDLNCRRTYVNPAFERETGIPAAQALQLRLEDGWRANIPVTEYLALLRQVMSTGEHLETVLEWPGPDSGEISVHAIQLIAERGVDGAVVSVLAKGHNITALKRHERLEEARLGIFERLAQGGPLPDVLALVSKYIEQARPDFLASIMLVDDDGRYLLPCSAPSLPPACDDFRERAIKAGLRACWPEPILDAAGKPLGSFCIHYSHQAGLPTDDDLKLVQQASHLAAIAIERKRAEKLLLESEQRYREIFDNSLDALFLLEVTEEGRFRNIEVNPAFERSVGMGRAELIGKTIEETVPPPVAATVIAKYRRCVDSGSPIDEEVELDLPTGHLAFHSTLIPVRGACGRIRRIVGITRDITERKHAERVLHAREQEFRALVENTPDVIARFDPQCRFLYANPAAQRMLGRPLTDLLGRNSSEASPHSNAARSFQGKLEQIVRTGVATEEEFALDAPVTQSAEAACFQVRLVPERDRHGQLVSILAVGRNISAIRAAERRLKESHAQLRKLASHGEMAREEERKRIAREIHDELGQQLTALRMGISLLRLQFGKDQPLLVERVQALMARVDETIQVVRNVATSLRPSALDMGLTSALEWLVSEFSRHTGVPCRLAAPSARLELDDERATAAFRVIQESLTNVTRHAQASRVDVRLERDHQHVLIEVCDDGKGFDPGQPPKGTLGMLGMRERGHMLGGAVTIDSAPGRGTRVQLQIPFRADPEEP